MKNLARLGVVWALAALGVGPGGIAAADGEAERVEKALPSGALRFVAVPPCRLADTRDAAFTGAFGPPSLVAAATRDFPVAGHCGVALTAQAVSLNVTVVNPDRAGFIGLWPGGDPQPSPLVSSLNYVTGQVVPNAVIAPLGSTGAMTVLTVGKTDLILDVNGYYDVLVPVESLNGLSGALTIQAGTGVGIASSGQTLTVSTVAGPGSGLDADTVDGQHGSAFMPGLSCSNGQVPKRSGATWICGDDLGTSSGGTVTSVATGSGLTGGPVVTSGTISVATGGITSTMVADGAILSSKIASGAVGAAQINTSQVQARVVSTCPVDHYVRGINADGGVLCGTAGSGLPDSAILLFSTCPDGWSAVVLQPTGVSPFVACEQQGANGPGLRETGLGTISGETGYVLVERSSPSSSFHSNQIDFGGGLSDAQLSLLAAQGEAVSGEATGGTSGYADAISYEVLSRAEEAILLKPGSDVEYTSPGASIDFLVGVGALKIGISVVRAFNFPGPAPLTIAQAQTLLTNKLSDLQEAAALVVPGDRWTKPILFVVTPSAEDVASLQQAYDLIEPSTKANTILYVTRTDGADSFVY